ncbi:MAG: sigma-70 family RNA polymerase sigma factor [Armatimonadetes bacterium]|nr:sigma-70 family RNA polymerase sigma factor [Armatimonadota bacterium]MBM3956952.1 sigma-70 family RNA polymerase sigma factor [Gemmatimonadota bacterium]
MGHARPRLLYLRAADEELPDGQLACAAAAGDMWALEELFRRYEPRVVRYLQRLVRDEEGADDLFQDASLRAYVNLSSFHPDRSFRAWLYRIATNAGLDWIRRRRRALPAAQAEGVGPPPEVLVIERDLVRRAEQAMAELSDDHRTVFLLRHFGQLSYAEIAQIVGSPEGTVRSRMHYAVRALREKLRYLREEEGHDDL